MKLYTDILKIIANILVFAWMMKLLNKMQIKSLKTVSS